MTGGRRKSISVVVPVLNEEESIADLILAVSKMLNRDEPPWEIIVVDNGSVDETCAVVERFTTDVRVRLIRNGSDHGKGYSIRRGMIEAQYQMRLMCDADCMSSLESLGRMEEALEGAHIVLGSRVALGSYVALQQPWRRRIVGFGFLMLTRLVLGRLARDVYCGFKLWTADAAEKVFPMVTLDGWVFDAEALALGRKFGFTAVETGIEWTDRPNSRLSIRTELVPAVKELWMARRNVRRAVPPTSP